jgi:hypothetical protein
LVMSAKAHPSIPAYCGGPRRADGRDLLRCGGKRGYQEKKQHAQCARRHLKEPGGPLAFLDSGFVCQHRRNESTRGEDIRAFALVVAESIVSAESALDDVSPALHRRSPDLIADVVDLIANRIEVSVREGVRRTLGDLSTTNCSPRRRAWGSRALSAKSARHPTSRDRTTAG